MLFILHPLDTQTWLSINYQDSVDQHNISHATMKSLRKNFRHGLKQQARFEEGGTTGGKEKLAIGGICEI